MVETWQTTLLRTFTGHTYLQVGDTPLRLSKVQALHVAAIRKQRLEKRKREGGLPDSIAGAVHPGAPVIMERPLQRSSALDLVANSDTTLGSALHKD